MVDCQVWEEENILPGRAGDPILPAMKGWDPEIGLPLQGLFKVCVSGVGNRRSSGWGHFSAIKGQTEDAAQIVGGRTGYQGDQRGENTAGGHGDGGGHPKDAHPQIAFFLGGDIHACGGKGRLSEGKSGAAGAPEQEDGHGEQTEQRSSSEGCPPVIRAAMPKMAEGIPSRPEKETEKPSSCKNCGMMVHMAFWMSSRRREPSQIRIK